MTPHRPGEGLRVFFMADHLGYPGGRVHGGTTYCVNTLPALARAGVELTVVFMAPRHPAAEQLEQAGVSPHFLGLSKWDPRSLTAFRDLLGRRNHDVAHLHSFKSHFAGRLAAHRRGLPTVVHVHDHIGMGRPLRFLQRRLASRTGALVGISESVTRFGMREYGVPQERCHTVRHGIDLRPFLETTPSDREAVREEVGTAPDRPVLAIVGRINPDKGQDQLLRAMPRILDSVPDAELWLVGDGPSRENFRALAAELGVEPSTRFLGHRSDIPEILAAVDFTVLPSMWQEGFGLAALESLAAGKPVVAFESGGVNEVVRPRETGLLVEQGDVDALGRAVVELLRDPELRRELGSRGREHAKTFSQEQHVDRMIEVYDSAIRWTREEAH